MVAKVRLPHMLVRDSLQLWRFLGVLRTLVSYEDITLTERLDKAPKLGSSLLGMLRLVMR